MPGFPYLSGLDPRLAWARRGTPRLKVAEGAVIIGGAQAGIMPMTAPSGWHIIGHTDVKLFKAEAELPVLLRPGDKVQFTIAGIEA
jgi:KipI family sensor histidine kinase inhibitor